MTEAYETLAQNLFNKSMDDLGEWQRNIVYNRAIELDAAPIPASIAAPMLDNPLTFTEAYALILGEFPNFGTCRYCKAVGWPEDQNGQRLDPNGSAKHWARYCYDHADDCPVAILGRVVDWQLPARAVPFSRLPEGAEYYTLYIDYESQLPKCHTRYRKITSSRVKRNRGGYQQAPDPWLLVLPLEEPMP